MESRVFWGRGEKHAAFIWARRIGFDRTVCLGLRLQGLPDKGLRAACLARRDPESDYVPLPEGDWRRRRQARRQYHSASRPQRRERDRSIAILGQQAAPVAESEKQILRARKLVQQLFY